MYLLLAFIVGITTATQSRLNGQLSHDVGNGYVAAIVSFGTGLIILTVLNFSHKKRRAAVMRIYSSVKERKIPAWQIMGGMVGGSFVAVQSITVPHIGVAIFSIATIAGQTVASLIVDKYGISPRGHQAIDPIRIFVAVVTLFAVTVSVFPSLGKSNFQYIPILLGFIVGFLTSFQHAYNGHVNEITKEPFATAFNNFAMGTSVLSVVLIIDLFSGAHVHAFPHQWWLYLGGSCGIFNIAATSHVVKHLGMLNYIALTVGGQLVTAIFYDWAFPTDGVKVTTYLISGTAMTIVAIGFASISHRSSKTQAFNSAD